MKLHCFNLSELPVTPWKNGGGQTREITSQPSGQAAFDWRASIATIAQNGAFSSFNGIDRSITLLEGDGVHLYSAGQIDHQLQHIGEPFSFSGDVALEARLLGGCSQDFNIMTRRGHQRAQVHSITATTELVRHHAGVLYVLKGVWQLPDGSLLSARQGGWWQPGEGPQHLMAQTSGGQALWADIASV